MTWLKTDDGYYDHAKIAELTSHEYRFHHGAQLLCARLETDGVISAAQLWGLLRQGMPQPLVMAARLVELGLWDDVGNGRWQIHDFLDYNPSKADLSKRRQADAARKQRWRAGRTPGRVTDDETKESRRDTTRDGTRDSSITRPDPTRPVNTSPPTVTLEDDSSMMVEGVKKLITLAGYEPTSALVADMASRLDKVAAETGTRRLGICDRVTADLAGRPLPDHVTSLSAVLEKRARQLATTGRKIGASEMPAPAGCRSVEEIETQFEKLTGETL